jgi:DNA primase
MISLRPQSGDDDWGDQMNMDRLSIVEVISQFLPDINITDNKIICPFPNHKGGAESSASFNIYPAKNNTYCFGCKIYCKPVDFVMHLKDCSRSQAIDLLRSKNYSLSRVKPLPQEENKEERFAILLNFSQSAKRFRDEFPEYEQVAEDVFEVFDEVYARHDLTNAALREIVKQLLTSLESYEHSYSW